MKTIKYFSATWCGPCKTFKSVMNEIANDGYAVQYIDIDQSSAIAEQYIIRAVPTVVIEDNGIEVDRFVGALPKQMVLERLS